MKIKHIIVAAGIACAALIPSSSSRADMVTDWNETAEVVIRASTPSPPIQIRALAIVNAAIYDAVNGIAGNTDRTSSLTPRRPAPDRRPLSRKPRSRPS